MTKGKNRLKLYVVRWPDAPYNCYHGFAVWCRNVEEARNTHPDGLMIENWQHPILPPTWIDYEKRDELLIEVSRPSRGSIIMADFE